MKFRKIGDTLHYWDETLDKWVPYPVVKKEDAEEGSDEEDNIDNYERAMKGI